MKNNEKTNNLISLILLSLGTLLLLIIFFKNTSQMPLVLHYVNNFGDYLGTRINLIFLIFGAWMLLGLNIYLSKTVKKLSEKLFLFVNYGTTVVCFLYLILAMQLFFHNL